jgi:hypothetical protein
MEQPSRLVQESFDKKALTNGISERRLPLLADFVAVENRATTEISRKSIFSTLMHLLGDGASKTILFSAICAKPSLALNPKKSSHRRLSKTCARCQMTMLA